MGKRWAEVLRCAPNDQGAETGKPDDQCTLREVWHDRE